jgi:transcriptional regulator with XRE-family HTH domain
VALRSQTEIGRTIRDLLGSRSQAELARAIGLDPSAMSRVLSGQRSMDLSELAAVAEYFGVSSESLLFEDDQVFALRADCISDEVRASVQQCLDVIDGYLLLETAAK